MSVPLSVVDLMIAALERRREAIEACEIATAAGVVELHVNPSVRRVMVEIRPPTRAVSPDAA